jgi:hypothetical protein
MSNASTIRRQVSGTQQLTLAPLLGTVITTTATPFSLNNNGLTLTGGGIIPLSAGNTGLYSGTGLQIWIHLAGTLTGGTASTTTLIITLYEVPAASLPLASTVVTSANLVTAGATLIATSATGTLASAVTAGAFSLDAYVSLDFQNNLQGWFTAQVFDSTTGVAGGATKAATTIVKGLVGEQDLNFVAAAQLGGAETGVIVNLNEFEMSLV